MYGRQPGCYRHPELRCVVGRLDRKGLPELSVDRVGLAELHRVGRKGLTEVHLLGRMGSPELNRMGRMSSPELNRMDRK
eukprot:2959655-Rhodomonas_salina.1